MSNMYQVKVNDEIRTYEEGTSFETIAKDFQHLYAHKIVLGCENAKLFELRKTIKKDYELKFITLGDAVGNKTYKRSMCLMLVKAIHDICGHDNKCKVFIDFSISKGFYCTLDSDMELNQGFLDVVKQRMLEMVAEKMPIKKCSLHTEEAIARFHKHGMSDKERLFTYRRV